MAGDVDVDRRLGLPEGHVSRRDVLMGAAGVAGATAATTAGIHPDSPVAAVDDVEAVPPIVIGVAAAAAAGVTVGAAGGYVLFGGDGDDPQEVEDDSLQQSAYDAASAVVAGTDAARTELTSRFATSDDNPFINSAWSEVRAIAAREAAKGSDEGTILNKCQTAIREQATRAVVNAIETHNDAVRAIAPHILAQYQQLDVSNRYYARSDALVNRRDYDATSESGVRSWQETAGGTTTIFEIDVETPIPASDLESRDTDLVMLGISGANDASNSGDNYIYLPFNPQDADTNINNYSDTLGDNWSATIQGSEDRVQSGSFSAGFPDFPNVDRLLGLSDIESVLKRIQQGYKEISDNLDTFVSAVVEKVAAGVIDPSDLIGPQTLVSSFADTESVARLQAELVATGIAAPGDAGYQAEIDHPGLPGDDPLTGWLFIDPADGVDSLDVTTGTTIPSSDYRMCYFAYPSEVEGDPLEVQILDADAGDLSIIQLFNTDDLGTDPGTGNSTVEDDGNVTIDLDPDGDGNISDTDFPWADDPDNASGVVRVNVTLGDGTNETRRIDLANVTVNDSTGTATLPLNLNDPSNATLNEVVTEPSVGYETVARPVAQPSNPQEVLVRSRALDDYREQLADQYAGGGGGGGSGALSGLDYIPGVPPVGEAVIGVVGFVTVAGAVNSLSNS